MVEICLGIIIGIVVKIAYDFIKPVKSNTKLNDKLLENKFQVSEFWKSLQIKNIQLISHTCDDSECKKWQKALVALLQEKLSCRGVTMVASDELVNTVITYTITSCIKSIKFTNPDNKNFLDYTIPTRIISLRQNKFEVVIEKTYFEKSSSSYTDNLNTHLHWVSNEQITELEKQIEQQSMNAMFADIFNEPKQISAVHNWQ